MQQALCFVSTRGAGERAGAGVSTEAGLGTGKIATLAEASAGKEAGDGAGFGNAFCLGMPYSSTPPPAHGTQRSVATLNSLASPARLKVLLAPGSSSATSLPELAANATGLSPPAGSRTARDSLAYVLSSPRDACIHPTTPHPARQVSVPAADRVPL